MKRNLTVLPFPGPEFRGKLEWFVTFLCLTSVVRTAERVHRAEGDVGRCGVHESGQRASWRAAVSLPGCGAGGQYC